MKSALPLLLLFGVQAHAQSAEELFLKGQYAATVSEIERAPDSGKTALTLNLLGMSYHRLGKLAEAEATYERAIKAEPAFAAAHNNLGALYFSQRKFSDADREFRRASDRDVDSAILTENLHRSRYARDNARDARESADQLASTRPFLLEPTPATLQHFLAVVSLFPVTKALEASSHVTRADIFVARKMFEDAVVEYKRALAIDRYDSAVVNRLGVAYHNLHKYRESEQQYREALRIRPNQIDVMNNLGVIDYLRQDFSSALNRFRTILRLKPDAVTALRNMGACLFAMERWEEGIAAYQQALALKPDLFDPQPGGAGASVQMSQRNTGFMNFYLAKVFALRGDKDLAMSYLLKAVEAGFDDLKLLRDEEAFKQFVPDARFQRVIKTIEEKKSGNG
jgi:Flp pilus assembly protein TadD